MMKKNLLFLPVLLLCTYGAPVRAQVTDTGAQWTWVGGTTALNDAGSGAVGVPDPDNLPKSRTYAAMWTDDDGDLWLFGGVVNPSNVNLNDLWHYDMTTGQWLWVAGQATSNQLNQGTKGTTGGANYPGSRSGAATWRDNDGNFWMFSGQVRLPTAINSPGSGNDLWKYNPATGEWTWVMGDEPASAGSNRTTTYPATVGGVGVPGGRQHPATWVDAQNNLWMFGGAGPAATGSSGRVSDLWKFDIASSEWHWMGGSTSVNTAADYNGQANPGTPGGNPGARMGCSFWKDASGNFWVYGGSDPSSVRSDMWKYDPAGMQWTWMSGSKTTGVDATYGTRGVAAAANTPGSRYVINSWTDVNGKFWLFGGRWSPGGSSARRNDLWMYDPATNLWMWMKGDQGIDKHGVYGTKGTPDAGNRPGSRMNGRGWVDKSGNFWLFGGGGYGASGGAGSDYLNDFWRLAPVAVTPVQPGLFTAAPSPVCEGASNVSYTVPAVSGATAYEWVYSGGSGVTFPGGASTATPTVTLNFSVSATGGTLQVRAVNSAGAGPYRDTVITVSGTPAQPGAFTTSSTSVCQGQNNVTYTVPAVSGATTYEWSYTGGGATFSGTSSTAAPTNTVNFSGSATGGNIQVSAKNTCGTSAARSVTVMVGSAPAQPGAYTASSASVCQGQNNVTYTVPAVSGATTYEWSYTGGGATFSGTSSTAAPTNTVDFLGSATGGNIQVSAKNTCGTSTARSVSVTVNVPPVATVSPAGPVDICEDDSVTLTAGSGTGYSYQWKNGGTNVGAGSNTYAAHMTGSYKVVVTGPGGCKDSTQEVSVTVHNRPSGVLAPGDTAFCEGGVVMLAVQTQDTGLTYRWKNSSATIPLATADFLEVNETGVYTVVLSRTNTTGACTDTTPAVTVTVYPLPAADITWDGLTLHAIGGYAGYQWRTGGQPVAGATDSTFQPAADGGYSVTVTDSNGCSATSAVYNVTVGVDDPAAAGMRVRVYPNPSDGMLHIAAPGPVNITLSSMEGKLLLQQAGATAIDLGSCAPGVYLLRISDAGGTVIRTERVVRQERR